LAPTYKVRMRDPRWEARDRYAAGVVSEYSDYIGVVSDAPPYLNDDWFTLTEENDIVRILYKDNVIRSWRVDRSVNSITEPNFVRIPRNGKTYTVSLNSRGGFVCNCTGYSYRKTCSHIKEVEEIELCPQDIRNFRHSLI
jgi:hypothetical protein